MTITCTRRIQFCAGHRVYLHESKCANLHGHNYVALITCRAAALDDVGRVIDFSVIKELVGGWIDIHWDHGMIVNSSDPLFDLFMHGLSEHKLYAMTDINPTAENMALHLKDIAGGLLADHGIVVTRVRLWETENCYADA